MTKEIYKIDAAGRTIGRVASEAAKALRGKNDPNFERHVMPEQKVAIVNASRLSISSVKREAKVHERYSGYPGGFKLLSWDQIIAKKGYGEPLRLAIRGMLPSNRLRSKILQNLTITE